MILSYRKKIIWSLIFCVLVLLIFWLYKVDFGKNRQYQFGATFSQKYALELNLDWQKTLIALLDELKVKKFRLIAYWDLLESKEGVYNFKDLDWQIAQVKQRGGQIVLTIGNRVPRWPECHSPEWLYKLNVQEKNDKLVELLKTVVERYKNESAIIAWQVENEPFLKIFGQCPRPDSDLYKREVALVKSLSDKPVIATESGELSTWFKGGRIADQLGVSLYRITWNNIFGYFKYPFPPSFYYLKSKILALGGGTKQVFISELQAEPWLPSSILQSSLDEQKASMNLQIFQANLAYAKKTGLSPVYFWGAEWWYWLKQQGDSSIWDEAKTIWQ